MELYISAILANIIVFLLILSIKIYIDISYHRSNANDEIKIQVYTWKKCLHYSMIIPVIDIVTGEIKTDIVADKKATPTHIKRERRFINKTVALFYQYPPKIKRIMRLLRHYSRLYNIFIKRIMTSVSCEQLYCKTILGLEDAAQTAIVFGSVCTLKSVLVSRLIQKVRFNTAPRIKTIPVYGKNQFKIDFKCILSIRLGNVINVISYVWFNDLIRRQ